MLGDLPKPDPAVVAAAAAKVIAAHVAAPAVAAVGDALAAAKPAEEVAGVEKKSAAPGAGSKKGAVRGKGVARIVDEMKRTGHYLTDDTETVYRYVEDRGVFEPLSEQQLLAIALHQDLRSSHSKRMAILKQLQASTYVPKLTWGRVADCEIACSNGVVDVLTWERRPHRPEDRLERSLPIAWEPEDKAKCPTWLKVLDAWFPEKTDGGRRAALQQFMGYICLSHAKYKKAVVLFGESDTGKSVVAAVAKALVGDDYACRISVEDMDKPERLWLIKGKALNVITELSAEAMIADGGFKTLVSTEEPVMLKSLYVNVETYLSTAKHMVVTNILPRLNDHTAATFNRLMIIPFDVIIAEKDQDRDLLTKLKAELPGILRWAAEGARRLVQQHGQWPDVPASRAIMTSYRDEMNPMRQFLRERMVAAPDKMTPLHLVAKRFNEWNLGARNTGIKGVGKLLRAAGHANAIKVAKYDKRSITCVLGFKLAAAVNEPLNAGATTGTIDESGLEIIDARDGSGSAAAAMSMEHDEADQYTDTS